MTDRSAELDAYANRLNAAYSAREADANGEGVVLHADLKPDICEKCGGRDREPRPEGCPDCLAKRIICR